jgi:hypothetical protein
VIRKLDCDQTRQIIRDLVPLGIGQYRVPEQVIWLAMETSSVNVMNSGLGLAYGNFSGENPVGVLVGMVVPEPKTGVRVGIEHLWWSAPGHNGLPLLRAFEDDCRAAGCKRVIFGYYETVNPDRMRKIYAGLGYAPYNTSVSKEL